MVRENKANWKANYFTKVVVSRKFLFEVIGRSKEILMMNKSNVLTRIAQGAIG